MLSHYNRDMKMLLFLVFVCFSGLAHSSTVTQVTKDSDLQIVTPQVLAEDKLQNSVEDVTKDDDEPSERGNKYTYFI